MSMQLSGSGTIVGLAAGGLPQASVLPEDIAPSYLYSALGANVALNNTGLYFDGPSVAQGTVGVWFVIAHVSMIDTAAAASFGVKLWDGTTVIDSAYVSSAGTGLTAHATVCGVIVNPVGNLKVSVRDLSSANGALRFNDSANSKDVSITAVRIG